MRRKLLSVVYLVIIDTNLNKKFFKVGVVPPSSAHFCLPAAVTCLVLIFVIRI